MDLSKCPAVKKNMQTHMQATKSNLIQNTEIDAATTFHICYILITSLHA